MISLPLNPVGLAHFPRFSGLALPIARLLAET